MMSESEERGFVADLPDFAATDDEPEGYASPTRQRRALRRRSAGVTLVLVTLLVVVIFPRQFGTAWASLWSHFGNHTSVVATPVVSTLHSVVFGSLSAGSWQPMHLPMAFDGILDLAPVPHSGGASLVCATAFNRGRHTPGEKQPPLTLWRSTPIGTAWQQLPLPRITANACALSVAPDAPHRIALLAREDVDDQRGCATEQIWLSDDGGTGWRQVPHASVVPAATEIFDCKLWATARHIYLTTLYHDSTGWRTVFERNDDAMTWQPIAEPPGDEVWIDAAPVGNGDGVLATTTYAVQQQTTVTIWASQDAGRTWHALDTPAPAPYLAAPATTSSAIPSLTAPLYATDVHGASSAPFQEHVLQTNDGHTWTRLPTLPVPALSAPETGIYADVGALPDGNVVVLGADPQHAAPTDHGVMPSLWVWEWQAQAVVWDVAPVPLPAGAFPACCVGLMTALAPDADPGTHAKGEFLWAWSLADTPYRLFVQDAAPAGAGGGGPAPT